MQTMKMLIGLVLVLLVGGCSPPPLDPDMAARIASIEGRVAELEVARTQSGAADAEGTNAGSEDAGVEARLSEKEAFAQAARGDLAEQLSATVAEVEEFRFDEQTDTLLVTAASAEQDLDTAWALAQELADLWGDLGAFQPVLDLEVGEVRCACSSRLMKDVHAGTADRAAWQGACRGD